MANKVKRASRARSSEQRRAIMLGFDNKEDYNKTLKKFKKKYNV